jgi:hypothetical protein
MKTLKKTLAIALVTVIAITVMTWVLRSYGFRSMSFALLANFVLMDWVAIVSGILGPQARFYLPRDYYEPKRFEKEGRIYRFMGVHYFKRMVAKGPLSVLASINFRGKRARLDAYYMETLWGEAVHGMMFVAISLLAVYGVARSWYDAAVYLMVCNTLINLYPTMLQRYNRFRLTRVIQKRDTRSRSTITAGRDHA